MPDKTDEEDSSVLMVGRQFWFRLADAVSSSPPANSSPAKDTGGSVFLLNKENHQVGCFRSSYAPSDVSDTLRVALFAVYCHLLSEPGSTLGGGGG